MIKTQRVPYQSDDVTFEGYIAWDDEIEGPRPAVIVAHAWYGRDDFARKKAEELAKLGYIGFAADVYGRGIVASSNDEATELMTPLANDRSHLRKRIFAAYYTAKNHELVDENKIGAIGYCFGGLTALELMRCGANLKGTVCFHAVLKNHGDLDQHKHNGKILFLHGHEDPMVSQTDIDAVQKELTEAKVDWQFHSFGHTSHAFTNPEAHDKELGLIYNETAAKRSWLMMQNFFTEVFNG